MEDPAKRTATTTPGHVPRRCYGLQFLEGEILTLVGVAAGLKASLALSACCWSLRDTLACSAIDEQLFGGLYAAFAGVDNPSDAFLQPLPRHDFSERRRPSNLPARTSAPGYLPDNHPPLRLRTVDRAPSLPHPPSSLQGEPEPPAGKRARSLSFGHIPPEAVTDGAAARPTNDMNYPGCSSLRRGCLPDLRSEGEGSLSAPAQAHKQRNNQRPVTAECISWRMRLKGDMATGREPLETFVFAGQSKGKQDVLLAVVPSTPPVIAITCTTELALFSLDGTRLPVVAVSRRRWRRSGESTCPIEDIEDEDDEDDDDEDEDGDEGTAQVPAESHQRDIRCLAASPAGDMVATGSLDCTIRVRSVPGRIWVRRLRGHEAGVRCLAFHRTRSRLVSADSHGVIAAWDVFPVSRRLCKVQGHTDSVQVLTWTSGGERLASGALDGNVVVWSISGDGILVPVATYGGLCNPYRLVAIGRHLAFTSSTSPSMLTGISRNVVESDEKRGGRTCGGDDVVVSSVSKGAHITVVGVDPTSSTKIDAGRRRVSTGLARLQHLVAGKCVGAVMLSQTEFWAEEYDSSGDEGEDAFLGGGRVTHRPPRLCRVVSTERVTSFEDFDAAQSRTGPCCGGGSGSGGSSEAPQADWVKVLRCWSAAVRQPEMAPQHDPDITREGVADKCDSSNSSNNDTNNVHREDVDGGAVCTCAVFVGRTLFLGYDTGFIYAHRAHDGRRLYRLGIFGSVVHLVEAKGSLFAYAASGVVSRWSWGNE